MILMIKNFESNNKCIQRISTIKNKSENSHEKYLETKVTKLAAFKKLNSYQEDLFSLTTSNTCDQIFEMLCKKTLLTSNGMSKIFLILKRPQFIFYKYLVHTKKELLQDNNCDCMKPCIFTESNLVILFNHK